MSEYKPHFKPGTRFSGHKPIDAEAVRADIGVTAIPSLSPSKVTGIAVERAPDRAPTVTQRKSVTQTVGGDDGDLKAHILPHGKALIDRLLTVALDPNAKQNLSLQAIGMLLDRGWGKPGQTVETTETIADLTSLHLEALRNTVKR